MLRDVHLRLPHVGHLMEILKENDDFEFEETAVNHVPSVPRVEEMERYEVANTLR